jgi:PAS domain S-box-containing protein
MATTQREEPKSVTAREETLRLADLIDIPAIQALMDDFHALEPVGMAMVDIKGNVLVSTGWQDICTRFHRIHPDTARHCTESDTVLASVTKPGHCRAYHCKNHLWDAATPIVVDGRRVGHFFLGQFFYDDEPVDVEAFRQQARTHGFDEAEYLSALDRVPRLSRDKVERAMAYHAKLAELFSRLGERNLQLARTLEEQRQTARRLSESEERFHLMIKNSTDIIAVVDVCGELLYVSSAEKAISGYTAEEVTGRSIRDMIHPDDVELVQTEFLEAIAHPEKARRIQCRHLHKTEGWVDVEVVGQSFLDKDAVKGVIINVRDITERKRAEEKLQASAEQYRDIAATIPGVIYQLQANRFGSFDVPYMSAGCERLFERPLVDLNHSTLLFQHMHVGDRALFEHSLHVAARDMSHWDLEFRILKPDGQAKWLRGSANPRLLPDGNVIWNGVLLDIDELKHAEQKRHESEERFRLMVKNSSDIIEIIDAHGVIQYASSAGKSITGLTPEETTGHSFRDMIHPEDQAVIQREFQTMMAQPQKARRLQCRHRHKRGGWVHVEAIGQSFLDEPAVTGIFLSLRDITERIQAEQEMTRQMEELRRWHEVTLGREGRIVELKREVNDLSVRLGRPPPYTAAMEPPEAGA